MIYVYIDFLKKRHSADNHPPVAIYVGIGKERRLKNPKRNEKHLLLAEMYGYDRKVVAIKKDVQEAKKLEEEFVAKYKTFIGETPYGCNLTRGGDSGGGTWKVHNRKMPPKSAETKAKIGAANKGNKRTPEMLARASKTRTGQKLKPWSEEAKKRFSEQIKQRHATDPSHKQKIAAALKEFHVKRIEREKNKPRPKLIIDELFIKFKMNISRNWINTASRIMCEALEELCISAQFEAANQIFVKINDIKNSIPQKIMSNITAQSDRWKDQLNRCSSE